MLATMMGLGEGKRGSEAARAGEYRKGSEEAMIRSRRCRGCKQASKGSIGEGCGAESEEHLLRRPGGCLPCLPGPTPPLASLAYSPPVPLVDTALRGAGPISEDGPGFESSFHLFHGKDGVVPLKGAAGPLGFDGFMESFNAKKRPSKRRPKKENNPEKEHGSKLEAHTKVLAIGGQPVAAAPVVVVDASGGALHHRRSKPSFHEWKLFMSSRACDVLAEAGPAREKVEEDDVERTAEFKNILKEVEELGTSTLEWKDRKKLETAKLVALGSKAPKSFKMPVSMGVGMKRKREERVEQKRQDDIAQGIRSAKRTGAERKPPSRKRAEERGLTLSEGKFKGGVLYVTPPSAPERFLHKSSKGEDRFFQGAKGGGKKGKGGKKKGKR